MSLLMDALRRAESGKEKEQDAIPATASPAHTETAKNELELEPASEPEVTPADPSSTPLTHTEIDELLCSSTDSSENPAAAESSSAPECRSNTTPQLEPLAEPAVEETETHVPAADPVNARGYYKSAIWFVSGLVSVVAIVGGYYLWHSGRSGEQALVTAAMDLPLPAYAGLVEETPAPLPEPQSSMQEAVAKIPPAPAPAPVVTANTLPPADHTPVKRGAGNKSTTQQNIRIHKTTRADSIQAVLQKGYLAYKAKEYPQADKFYHQVLKRYPHNRDALLGIAAIAMLQGDYVTARRNYERILKSNPADTTARLGLQSILGSEDPPGRISQLKLMTDKHPRNAQLRFSLANQYAGLGQWTEAQQSYFEAVRLEPEQADYVYNLAISLDQLGLPEQALEFYLKARRLTVNNASLLDQQQLDSRIRQLQAADGGNS